VQAGGWIDVLSKGLRGGHNGSAFGSRGETFDTSDQIVAGAVGLRPLNVYQIAGASYGGVALGLSGSSVSNAPYGELEDPRHLGSGGGGLHNAETYWRSDHGGGRLTLTAGSLNVDGTIRADGGSGQTGGGGSGGAIKIVAGGVTGSGTITARGGLGSTPGTSGGISCGGGGRIAIYFDEMTLPADNISAASAEYEWVTGSAGTIYLKDNAQTAGSLIIDNDGAASSKYTPVLTELSTLGHTIIKDRGVLYSTTDGVAPLPTFDSIAVLTGSYLMGGAYPFIVTGGVRIDSGGKATHPLRLLNGLQLDVGGTLDVQAGGWIDVLSKGLRGGHNGSAFGSRGETFDTSDQIVAGAVGLRPLNVYQIAGASYGGVALGLSGSSVSNAPYGELEDPRHLGSGGGGLHNAETYWRSDHGGGRLTLTAGSLNVDGTIRADGGSGQTGGGGSGGAIKIVAGGVTGSGTITARGGLGSTPGTSGGISCGGGGRIAIYFDEMTLPADNISAASAEYEWVTGSAGTIYLKDNAQSAGSLVIDNDGASSSKSTFLLSTLQSFLNIKVRGSSSFDIRSEISVTGELLVDPGAKIGND